MTADERLARFPWPFDGPRYRYGVDVEPARGPVVDVDDRYRAELAQRRRILDADPGRHAVLPHMGPAAWEAVLVVLRELARARPDDAALERRPDGTWRWRNDLLGTDQSFVLGDDASLPGGPLRFAGEQVQEDLVLLDQREGALWVDAGLVTFASGWSLAFDLGMSFAHVHGPVPRVHEEGVVSRAEQFLLRLAPGEPFRRTNWSMALDDELDASLEALPSRDRTPPAPGDLGARVHLRVEVQHLLRLSASGAVLFLIRTHLLPLALLAGAPARREQLAAVLEELPADVAGYKGFAGYRREAVAWLRAGGG